MSDEGYFSALAKPLTRKDLEDAFKMIEKKDKELISSPPPVMMHPIDYVHLLLETGAISGAPLTAERIDAVLDEFRRLRSSKAESIVEKLATCPRDQYDTVKKLAQNFIHEREERRKEWSGGFDILNPIDPGEGSEQGND